MFDPTLNGTSLKFEAKTDNASTLLIDPDLMEQVIINLLKNAKEASKDNSTIKLSYKRQNQTHIIEIQDSGTGIPANIQDRIFIPFYTTKENGSGIGLSLVQQVVRLHKGQIDFETSDQGTTFRITL